MRTTLVVLGLLLAGCSSATSSAPAKTDAGADPGASRSLTCAAVFDCASPCADSACEDACLARGSAEAQQAALAVAKCFNDNQCTDAPCLSAHCQAELDGCFAQGRTVGTPLDDGGAVPGTVPTQLAGSWAHAAWGQTERFKLASDGTGYYQSSLSSQQGCVVTDQTIWNGTAVVDATTITIYATTVTTSRDQCGQKTKTSAPPQTLHFSYVYDAGTDVLSVIDNTCAAKYPDSPSSQLLYCKNEYARE